MACGRTPPTHTERDLTLHCTPCAGSGCYLAEESLDFPCGGSNNLAEFMYACGLGGYDAEWHQPLMEKLASRALDLIGCDSVYVFQFCVNSKAPSAGTTEGKWALYRDYDFWHGMDGMPTTRAVVMHVLAAEHTATNGPVAFVDGSHEMDVAVHSKDDVNWEAGFAEKSFKYTIDSSLIGSAPCTAMTGKAGAITAMHLLTWHDSSPNISTKPRVLLNVVFNDASNLPVQPEGTAEASIIYCVQAKSHLDKIYRTKHPSHPQSRHDVG